MRFLPRKLTDLSLPELQSRLADTQARRRAFVRSHGAFREDVLAGLEQRFAEARDSLAGHLTTHPGDRSDLPGLATKYVIGHDKSFQKMLLDAVKQASGFSSLSRESFDREVAQFRSEELELRSAIARRPLQDKQHELDAQKAELEALFGITIVDA
jgi:hypothetical protein